MKINNIGGIMALLSIVFLAGCSTSNTSTSNPNDSDVNLTYNDLYNVDTSKRPLKVGKTIYKASDGYMSNSDQGYNNFSYVSKNNNSYELMAYSNDKFIFEDSYFQNGIMHSGSYASSIMFAAPETGDVTISGEILIIEGVSNSLSVFKNDTLIKEIIIEDGSKYLEIKLSLNKNDKLYFVLNSEGSCYFNPKIDYTSEKDQLIHQTIDGEYGDVHPYYDVKNKRMIMYYLSTGREVNSAHEMFSTLATSSNDMTNFNQLELSKNKANPPSITTYYALGVYEDADGNYRSCFGMGNYVGNSKSTNLEYWENGEEPFENDEGMLDYHHRVKFGSDVYSGRDPHIYYDKDSEKYYCIVMNYYSSSVDKGSKGLAIYEGNKLGDYDSNNYYKALDTTGRGDPECPQLYKINDRYYIFYSIYGTGTSGNVGKLAYRIGDLNKSPLEVNWNEKEELYLDGGDLHAAQLCQVGDMFYMYGWLTSSPKKNIWGGTLNMSREVFQNENGTLGTRIDPTYKQLLNKGLIDKYSSFSDAPKQTNRSIVSLEFNNNEVIDTGINVTSNGKTYFIGIKSLSGKDYLLISDNESNPLDFINIQLNEKITNYKLDVYLDGGYVEAFLNDQYGISSHVEFNEQYSVKLQNNDISSTFEKCSIYKLSNSQDILD